MQRKCIAICLFALLAVVAGPRSLMAAAGCPATDVCSELTGSEVKATVAEAPVAVGSTVFDADELEELAALELTDSASDELAGADGSAAAIGVVVFLVVLVGLTALYYAMDTEDDDFE